MCHRNDLVEIASDECEFVFTRHYNPLYRGIVRDVNVYVLKIDHC